MAFYCASNRTHVPFGAGHCATALPEAAAPSSLCSPPHIQCRPRWACSVPLVRWIPACRLCSCCSPCLECSALRLFYFFIAVRLQLSPFSRHYFSLTYLPFSHPTCSPPSHCLCPWVLFDLLTLERERKGDSKNIDMSFHLFMHSLVASCTCPDQGLNPQPCLEFLDLALFWYWVLSLSFTSSAILPWLLSLK